jgi:hypothetical protein
MSHLFPSHLREHGTGYNPAVKGTEPFCRASSILHQVPDLRTALYAPTNLDILSTTAFGYKWTQFQKRGTCVGQATKLGRDIRNACLYLLFPHLHAHILNPAGKLARFAVAPAYGAGRVEASGNVGKWDGCAVSWIAEAITSFGTLPRYLLNLPETHSPSYANERGLEPDEQMAVDWAASRQGVPAEYESLMNAYVGDMIPVRNIEECALSICNFKPVQQGSTIIPTGRCNSSGTSDCESGGGHSTLFAGIRSPGDLSLMVQLPKDPIRCEYFYKNSWGDWGFEDTGGVWIPGKDAEAMIAQGDTYAHNK